MSFYDDYVAEGLCCESCGGYLDGDEPGYSRMCAGCRKAAEPPRGRKPRAKRG